jgi:hypothetical protein
VTEAKLVHREDLVVALDYGQFYLHTRDNDPEVAVELLEQALDGDGIAQADGLLVVLSPHQNNFAMPLAVEVWDGEPARDVDEWQEAFQAHIEVTTQFGYESPTDELIEIAVPSGSYAVLITGRGFVAHGWPGSTEPGDQWRIRLWPSEARLPPRPLKRWSETPAADAVQIGRAPRRREKQRPKRVFDLADPTRRALIQRIQQLSNPPASEYRDVDPLPGRENLDVRTIFQVVPRQLMLVLTGPESDSLDPHGYLRRARTSIAAILRRVSDARARPLNDLDKLIEDILDFDATDRKRTPVPRS